MALFIILVFILAASEKLLEYQLHQNFGDTFYDYSGHFRQGVNGRLLEKDEQDTIPSDRGAYFSGSKSMILIPETSLKEEKVMFYTPYSIVTWAKILYGKSSSDALLINRIGSGGDYIKLSIGSSMEINLEYNFIEPSDENSNAGDEDDTSNSGSADSLFISSSSSSLSSSSSGSSSSSSRRKLSKLNGLSSFNSNKRYLFKIEQSQWTLLRIQINTNSIEIFINEYSKETQSISSYSELNQNYSMHIGGSPKKSISIKGYIWSLAVDKNFKKDYYSNHYTKLHCCLY